MKQVWLWISIIFLILAISGIVIKWFSWFDAHDWVATLILSTILALSTIIYTFWTASLADQAQKQTEAVNKQLDIEKTPNLIVTSARVSLTGKTSADTRYLFFYGDFVNLGRYPVLVTQICLFGENDLVLVSSPVSRTLANANICTETFKLRIPDRAISLKEGQKFDGEVGPGTVFMQQKALDILKKIIKVAIFYQYGATGRQYHFVVLRKLLDPDNLSDNFLEGSYIIDKGIILDGSDARYGEDLEPPDVDKYDRF